MTSSEPRKKKEGRSRVGRRWRAPGRQSAFDLSIGRQLPLLIGSTVRRPNIWRVARHGSPKVLTSTERYYWIQTKIYAPDFLRRRKEMPSRDAACFLPLDPFLVVTLASRPRSGQRKLWLCDK